MDFWDESMGGFVFIVFFDFTEEGRDVFGELSPWFFQALFLFPAKRFLNFYLFDHIFFYWR